MECTEYHVTVCHVTVHTLYTLLVPAHDLHILCTVCHKTVCHVTVHTLYTLLVPAHDLHILCTVCHVTVCHVTVHTLYTLLVPAHDLHILCTVCHVTVHTLYTLLVPAHDLHILYSLFFCSGNIFRRHSLFENRLLEYCSTTDILLHRNISHTDIQNGSANTWCEHVVWTAVRGVNRGTRCEQRYAVWTGVRGVNRGTRCEQWYVVWTAVRGVNRGTRCEQWYVVWTGVRGVNSGTWWEGELNSAAVNSCKCEGIISMVPWSRSLPFSFNKHALCSRTCSRNFQIT